MNWASNLASNAISQRVADNCAADGIPGTHNGAGSSATIFSSGGFGTLDAETSTSKSIGVVWTPDFADLQVSLDYFDIEVENEVTKLGANNILLGCYDSLNFATEPLCNLFERNPGTGSSTDYLVTTVTDNFLNIATQRKPRSRPRRRLPHGNGVGQSHDASAGVQTARGQGTAAADFSAA